MNPIIFLYGAPASGKSTLGRRLAAALKTDFFDLDAEIVAAAGRTIPEIFATEGEVGFRDRESVALEQTIASAAKVPRGAVIALGGGSLLREANRARCEAAGTIWCLETPSAAELARRLGVDPASRPLGDKARERAPHYASFANRVAAFFEAGESLVVVGSSLAAAVLPRFPVVADQTVAELYFRGRDSSSVQPLCTIASGEEHKTIATVASLWSAFAAAGLGRRDLVCACGGGVTGDLTGFAAATWMRGIDWVNVPTTLLAMVDASTGGKTGCDLPEGKNLAGAFHAPRLVVIDTDFLRTLPAARLADGKAEMIKHQIIEIGDERISEKRVVPTAKEIAENLLVKVKIVREDPFETKGRRLLLNCGHTIAHAVEKLSGYRVSHGEAVAIGCVEEARLAVRLGLAAAAWPEELARAFAAAGLPTEYPACTRPAATSEAMFERLKPLMRGDKKHAGDTVTFALPCGWGDVRATDYAIITEKGKNAIHI